MRSPPASFRLSFLLPAGADACSGSHRPSPEGCLLHVTAPLVEIAGPSREAVFEHAARFLRVSCRGLRTSLAARLQTPARPSGTDTWSIILGADVAFSPTSLDPHFPSSPRLSECRAPAANARTDHDTPAASSSDSPAANAKPAIA
jgi:hypothetical protein